LISKILVGRKTSEVVENTDELSFGEGQGQIELRLEDWKRIAEKLLRKKTGDVYNIRQVGSAGPNSKAHDLILDQTNKDDGL